MIDKIDGSKPNLLIYDEVLDPRISSQGEIDNFLKAWDEAFHGINKEPYGSKSSKTISNFS